MSKYVTSVSNDRNYGYFVGDTFNMVAIPDIELFVWDKPITRISRDDYPMVFKRSCIIRGNLLPVGIWTVERFKESIFPGARGDIVYMWMLRQAYGANVPDITSALELLMAEQQAFIDRGM